MKHLNFIIIVLFYIYYLLKSIIKHSFKRYTNLGLGTHLFVKVPRPGDSEVTFEVFESRCHLLLPV